MTIGATAGNELDRIDAGHSTAGLTGHRVDSFDSFGGSTCGNSASTNFKKSHESDGDTVEDTVTIAKLLEFDDEDTNNDDFTEQEHQSEKPSEYEDVSNESALMTAVPAAAASEQSNQLNALLIAAADLGNAQS